MSNRRRQAEEWLELLPDLTPADRCLLGIISLWRRMRRHVRRREFFEETLLYAKPLIIGALAFAFYPSEFLAGAGAGAVVSGAIEIGRRILERG